MADPIATVREARRTNIARLRELVHAVTEGREAVAREFTMRVPAEYEHDADLVLSTAADEIERLREDTERQAQEIAALRADAERYRWLRDCAPNVWYGDEFLDAIDGKLDSAIDAAMKQEAGNGN